jgi:murein tripeptide amidase MpaA
VNAADGNDGKPIFLQMGLHHAREWPSGEHAMEWAFELVKDYKAGDPRTRSIMARTRTIVIPVVNPDGFNTSREAGESAGAGGGRGGSNETANLVIPYEYQRKNCRTVDPSGGPDPA